MNILKQLLIIIIFKIYCTNISKANYITYQNQLDTFNYKISENITKDYLNFLKHQGIDTILILYTSEGKSIKYINITNYIYVFKGHVYLSFHTIYPIDSKKKGQIYFAQNKLLKLADENKYTDNILKILNLSKKTDNESKPFNNMWKKRKWRKLYLFGLESDKYENIYTFNAVSINNRSYGNTKLSNHAYLFKQKRIAKKMYHLLKNYTLENIKKILE
ncbi:MAG: hypothetical protein A2046_14765 [Bacteroidetes bacterium GWA2_30_7]|nr:MAG: hypothetical protein A2046_14765 [Bacteroidetes bacterium GWA2_30_7]